MWPRRLKLVALGHFMHATSFLSGRCLTNGLTQRIVILQKISAALLAALLATTSTIAIAQTGGRPVGGPGSEAPTPPSIMEPVPSEPDNALFDDEDDDADGADNEDDNDDEGEDD